MATRLGAATLLALAFARFTIALEYRSKMVNQRISYFENAYLDVDVKFYGDEGYPYLTMLEDVTPYNDLHLMVFARRLDGQPILFSRSPVSLCQLLHDASAASSEEYLSSPMARFGFPQIFNFNGMLCPIEQSTIRLSPYVFPANFTFDESLGCGYRIVEARLMKCAEETTEGVRDCETLLKNVLHAYVEHEHCQSDAQDGVPESEGNWILDKVVEAMKTF
ncbi:uncharacterized protein LOC131669050 [Phymastichus coffea]|uniref:uncharacterized protein LOC131669050 n=1 Tax=Phymastichus coffea TaxID=108790 RepID=UPI00273A8FDC|nr:uncharacterized protein LOC131669050 [Phymastichus coffea]